MQLEDGILYIQDFDRVIPISISSLDIVLVRNTKRTNTAIYDSKGNIWTDRHSTIATVRNIMRKIDPGLLDVTDFDGGKCLINPDKTEFLPEIAETGREKDVFPVLLKEIQITDSKSLKRKINIYRCHYLQMLEKRPDLKAKLFKKDSVQFDLSRDPDEDLPPLESVKNIAAVLLRRLSNTFTLYTITGRGTVYQSSVNTENIIRKVIMDKDNRFVPFYTSVDTCVFVNLPLVDMERMKRNEGIFGEQWSVHLQTNCYGTVLFKPRYEDTSPTPITAEGLFLPVSCQDYNTFMERAEKGLQLLPEEISYIDQVQDSEGKVWLAKIKKTGESVFIFGTRDEIQEKYGFVYIDRSSKFINQKNIDWEWSELIRMTYLRHRKRESPDLITLYFCYDEESNECCWDSTVMVTDEEYRLLYEATGINDDSLGFLKEYFPIMVKGKRKDFFGRISDIAVLSPEKTFSPCKFFAFAVDGKRSMLPLDHDMVNRIINYRGNSFMILDHLGVRINLPFVNMEQLKPKIYIASGKPQVEYRLEFRSGTRRYTWTNLSDDEVFDVRDKYRKYMEEKEKYESDT